TVSPLQPLVPLTRETASGSSRGPENGLTPRAQRQRWPTPSARDWKDTPGMAKTGPGGRNRTDQLARRVFAVENTPPGGGVLNPTWVEWLLGFPPQWTVFVASGTE